ncbi:MAG: L-threonylcarbamoyladenylate synthase [Candidatus Kapabacteria bacterium]|jgi:L-threonylcarbamoyladenylate synthase|nr:L-threonylcarbamoyladenylate synthase [Candidatus Kapabacteria bacterium]
MKTEIIKVSDDDMNWANRGVEYLKSGLPVAFPTETVYGVGSGIFDLSGVERVYGIKGRNFMNPLSAHISDLSHVELLCHDIRPEFYLLAEKFLPGPLSIIMRKRKEVPDIVSGGGDTLSIRFPDNKYFLSFAKMFGQPIAATSANISGKPSPVSAQDVFDDLGGKIPMIIDGGKCRYRIESTVISLAGDKAVLIRPGVISQEEISRVLGYEIISYNRQIVAVDNMKSSLHNSSLKILCFDNIDKIIDFCENNNQLKIAVMSRNTKNKMKEFEYIKTDANEFFDNLRELEKNGTDVLLIEKDEYVMTSEVLRHRLKIN